MKNTYSEHLNTIIKYSAILAAIIFLALVPEKVLFWGSSVCIYKHLTGCLCPLCGMTHATYFLIRMHLIVSYAYNPAILWFPVLLLMEILHDLFPIHRPIRYIRVYSWILFGCTIILILVFRIMSCIK